MSRDDAGALVGSHLDELGATLAALRSESARLDAWGRELADRRLSRLIK